MKTAIAAMFVLLSASAHAQGIYRCGIDFSQQPCGPNAKDVQALPVKAKRVGKLPDTPPAQDLIEKNKAACTAAVRNGMKDPDAAKIGIASRRGLFQRSNTKRGQLRSECQRQKQLRRIHRRETAYLLFRS